MRRVVQSGFTLIELMVVVAIIGLLAAVAFPAYQDFVTRSKISEAIAATGKCKTTITELIQSGGTVPTAPAGWSCGSAASQYVETITVNPSGSIAINLRNLGTSLDNGILWLKPCSANAATFSACEKPGAGTNVSQWLCGSSPNNVIPDRYLPASCRAK